MKLHTAEIVGMTQPLAWADDSPRNPEELLAYCARVSATANQHKHETGPRLLKSLVRRREWSPFEMVSVTMEIVTTRDIARQILRHRSFSFQEFSQRYAAVEEPPVLREARDQDPKDRQSSTPTVDGGVKDWWIGAQREIADVTRRHYETALNVGIAKEVARTILPEGMTYSRLYMAGTLRSWIHYVQLRSGLGTQFEHRLVAAAAWSRLIDNFPSLTGILSEQVDHEG